MVVGRERDLRLVATVHGIVGLITCLCLIML